MWKNVLKGFRKTTRIWWFEFRMIFFSVKWIVISIFTFFLVKFYLEDVIVFADAFGLKDYPAVLPFLFADYGFISLGMIILIFIMSVFPIRNHLQQGVLVRSGDYCWVTGQFLTAVSVALLWILEIQAFILLEFGGRSDFTGWKKLWGTIAVGKHLDYGFSVGISVSEKVVNGYGPLQAILVSMLFVSFMAILYGEFIFCVDGICGNHIGEVILAVWSLMWLVVDNFHMLENFKILKTISPKNWLDIGRYAGQKELLLKNFSLMLALVIGLYILSIFLVKKKIIETE